MALGKGYVGQDCALARALEVIGERWTLLVIRDCFFGVRRFSDLQAHLDIPKAVLSARLVTLVDAGVLRRVEYTPGRQEYLLTPTGLELWPAIYALIRWGVRHANDGVGRLFVHVTCGTLVDDEGRCAHCDTRPGPEDLELRPNPASEQRRADPVTLALEHPHRLLTPLPPRSAAWEASA
jgi:DNA-binding HxlR family transcriptional regulator